MDHHGPSSDPFARNMTFPQISFNSNPVSMAGSCSSCEVSTVRVNCSSRDYSRATNLSIIKPLNDFQRTSVQLLSKSVSPTHNTEQSRCFLAGEHLTVSLSQLDPQQPRSSPAPRGWGWLSSQQPPAPVRIKPPKSSRDLSSSVFLWGAIVRGFVQKSAVTEVDADAVTEQTLLSSLWAAQWQSLRDKRTLLWCSVKSNVLL